MSLNGLDAPEILQAHQDTLAEPGGWFLLKYSSRDEVELLARGVGGLSETSIALAAYPEASPLYGLLHYRRRKVLLKYIPADTSRLLLARSGVHFQAFADQFAHDAQFNAHGPHDLSDAALSAVCPPHTATSTSLHSMTNSIKRQNLDEIFEDAEEAPRPPIPTDSAPAVAQAAPPQPSESVEPVSELEQPVTSTSHQKDVVDPPTPRMEDDFVLPSFAAEDAPRHSTDDYYKSSEADIRPATADSFRYEFDTWKPKEKARPRPVADDKVRKTGSTGSSRFALPAGMRMSMKRSDERPRSSKSHRSLRQTNGDAEAMPPLPTGPERPQISPMLSDLTVDDFVGNGKVTSPTSPAVDRGPSSHIHSLALDGPVDDWYPPSASDLEQIGAAPAADPQPLQQAEQPSPSAAKSKSAPMTLEKQRLMKALQMRKKQVELAKELSPVSAGSEGPDDAPEGSAYHSADEQVMEGKKEESLIKEKVSTPSKLKDEGAAVDSAVGSAVDSAVEADVQPEDRPKAPVRKRRDIENIKTDTPQSSEAGFQSDDSLLDELQTAQVQDATPVEVAHSPRTPTFGGFPKSAAVTSINIKRSPPSQPPQQTQPQQQQQQQQQISPGIGRSGRVSSMSQTSQETLSLSKGRNVSSGISKRIQALADNSSRDPSPGAQQRVESGPDVARSFLTIRNLASRPSSRGNGPIRGSQASRASSPSRSVAGRSLSYFRSDRSGQGDRAKTSYGAPSVSSVAESTMTARILQSADGASTKLTQTPVTLEQSKPRYSTATERPGSAASISSRKSSRTLMSKQSVETGWNFIKRTGRKSDRSPPATVRSMSSTSLERVDEDVPEEKEKESSSRASRLLKRMSGLSSSSRKHADKESDKQSRSSISKDRWRSSGPPPGFTLGDINVQFPDTLLWKRRWVEVDSFGNLVLGAAAGERTRGEKKKFHLRDFRPALAPSQERQELPHSIMLDFHHGGTLQLAFEDPIGQTTILRKLLDTQSGWVGHG